MSSSRSRPSGRTADATSLPIREKNGRPHSAAGGPQGRTLGTSTRAWPDRASVRTDPRVEGLKVKHPPFFGSPPGSRVVTVNPEPLRHGQYSLPQGGNVH